jgi:hypothetical protein
MQICCAASVSAYRDTVAQRCVLENAEHEVARVAAGCRARRFALAYALAIASEE